MSNAQMGFVVNVGGQDQVLACREMTPDLADVLRSYGFDPSGFNRMRWPHGAGRSASCRVVLTLESLNAIAPAATISGKAFKFRVGSVVFDRVYVRTPSPMIIGTRSVLYALEVVDERFHWRSRPGDADYNIYADSKTSKYTVTSQSSPTSIVSALIVGQGFVSSAEIDFAGLAAANSDTFDGLRDLRAQDLTFGEIIDRVCAVCGVVLVARPSPVGGKRYAFVPVEKGGQVATDESGIFAVRRDDLMAGGLLGGGPPGGAAAWIGSRADLGAEMPGSVRWISPTWVKENGYAYGAVSSSGPTWTTKTIHSVTTSFALVRATFSNWWPAGPVQPTLDNVEDLWDSVWTEVSQGGAVVDSAAASARARVVARLYYSRFIAGCGESLWRGCFDDFPIWSGALWREWAIASVGGEIIPYTRISGDWNDELFGWQPDQRPVTQGRIAGVGLARVAPRPDGGVLIDVPVGEVGAHVIAWLTAYSVIAGKVNRFHYSWEEVEWNAGSSQWQVKVGGRVGGFGVGEGPALNGAEALNDGTGRESVGVDITDTDTADVTLLPIGMEGTKPVYRLYRFKDGGATPTASRWLFTEGNEVDVECTDGAAATAAPASASSSLVTPQMAFIPPAVPMSGSVILPSATRVYFVYLGVALADFEWSEAFMRVETAGVGAQIAQVGVCLDDSPPDGSAKTFTIAGVADLPALTTTGGKVASPASTVQIASGDHVWMAVRVSMATTQPRMRAIDHDCGAGAVMHAVAPAQLSIGSSFAATVSTSSPSAPWVAMRGGIS